jgi:hypothetical protein
MKVYYPKGIRVHISNRTLKEALGLIFQSRPFRDYEPLKIVFVETKRTLYADKQAFLSYLTDDISLEELLEKTQCEELYRNTKDFHSPEGYSVDAGYLWRLENKTLYLIDDDNICATKFEISIFEIAE